jgi:hypothetical protein
MKVSELLRMFLERSSGMKQAHKVTTRFPTESDLGADNIRALSELINEVYDEAESGMWKRKGTRTSRAEVERLLRAQALLLAKIDGVLVGSVNVNIGCSSDNLSEDKPPKALCIICSTWVVSPVDSISKSE